MANYSNFDPVYTKISASTSGTFVTAVVGKRIIVLDYLISFSGSVNVKFQSHVAPTDLTGLLYGAADTQIPAAYCPQGHFATLIGEALDISFSAGTAIGGHITSVAV